MASTRNPLEHYMTVYYKFNFAGIMQLVKDGNIELLKSILPHLDVNDQKSFGLMNETLLHYAVDKGHKDVVVLLLERGANCTVFDRYDRTPLHLAAQAGYTDIVRLLVTSETCVIDVNDRFGRTPLYLASESGDIDTVRLLLSMGADVNEVTYENETALHCAVFFGHDQIVTLLLTYKPKLDILYQYQRTPLCNSIIRQESSISQELLLAGATIGSYKLNEEQNAFFEEIKAAAKAKLVDSLSQDHSRLFSRSLSSLSSLSSSSLLSSSSSSSALRESSDYKVSSAVRDQPKSAATNP